MSTRGNMTRNTAVALLLLLLALTMSLHPARAASVIGTSANLSLTYQVPSQWLSLVQNTLGWQVIYQPSWVNLYPAPVVSTVEGLAGPLIPPTSTILVALDDDIDPGRYWDRLVLQDLDTGYYAEATVSAVLDDPDETVETARLIVYTNTAATLDMNIDINTGTVGKYFVFLEHEQLLPGQRYAYVPQGKLVLFSSFGFPVANAEDLYLAEGVDVVSLMMGQFPLAGLEGTLLIQVDRSTANGLAATQEIFYDIATISGDWEITDTYRGVAYPPYSAELHEGFGLFSGRWMGHAVTGGYSPDGSYVLSFSDGRFTYFYAITDLGTSSLSGLWSYSGDPGTSYPFMGRKRASLFPVSSQVNGVWNLSSEEASCCCPLPGLFEGPAVVSVTGGEVRLGLDRGDLAGTMVGNEIRLSGVFPSKDGVLSVRASGTFTVDGGRLYGTARWVWASEGMSCEGSSVFSGVR
jgi:hypothetical protein